MYRQTLITLVWTTNGHASYKLGTQRTVINYISRSDPKPAMCLSFTIELSNSKTNINLMICSNPWLKHVPASVPGTQLGLLLSTPIHYMLHSYIENTGWVSFDIKFTRQGFENACWHREACDQLDIKRRKPGILFISLPIVEHLKLAIMTTFLIFVLIQCHKRRHSKSATSSWPDIGNMPWDKKRLLGYVETTQLI